MREGLIIVDLLRDFMEPDGALYCGDDARRIIPAVAKALGKARREGIPVLYLADLHDPEDAEFEMFPPHCVRGTAGSEVLESVKPLLTEEIVPKRRFSGFFSTDLDLRLRERGLDTLVLMGVSTNICVLYTAADARMRGYQVIVPRDAVASFDAKAGESALRHMERVLGVKVVSTWV